MDGIALSFARTPNYVRAFGPWHGARLWVRLEAARKAATGQPEYVGVPWLEHPVWLRPTHADRSVFWQNVTSRQYDTTRFPHHHARLVAQEAGIRARGRTPVVLDLGGNIGLAAVWLAQAWPGAVVLSVEPDEANFAVLQRNAACWGRRIRPVRAAVTDRADRELRIANPDAGASAYWTREGVVSGERLPVVTVPELMALVPDGELFIAKIDIEGAQAMLFESATGWLNDVHLVAIELDDWLLPWQGTSRPFMRAVSALPYDYLLSGETLFCFRDLKVST